MRTARVALLFQPITLSIYRRRNTMLIGLNQQVVQDMKHLDIFMQKPRSSIILYSLHAGYLAINYVLVSPT